MTAELPGVRRVEQVMGMPIVLDVRDDPHDEAAIEAVFEWLRLVDARFSTYRTDSDVSRLNRDELLRAETHDDVREVLDRCDELRRLTGGFFDMRYAGHDTVDPSGLVKGWAVDRGAAMLDEAGICDYALNAGGDMRLRGGALPAPHWTVGIEHPRLPEEIAAALDLTDIAVATSGAYVRGDHVLDPHSHEPPRDVLSVTVIGPELATADAFATAAFAMGSAGPRWTAGLRGYEAMTILADDRVVCTGGFPSLG